MVKNRLKINDAKTEFIIFRSPQEKQDISGVSVCVGDSQILQASKVRDLGVIFDKCHWMTILVMFASLRIFILEI